MRTKRRGSFTTVGSSILLGFGACMRLRFFWAGSWVSDPWLFVNSLIVFMGMEGCLGWTYFLSAVGGRRTMCVGRMCLYTFLTAVPTRDFLTKEIFCKSEERVWFDSGF